MSRNKLSPRTAGQGVSESSLAGYLHAGGEIQRKGEGGKKNMQGLSKDMFAMSVQAQFLRAPIPSADQKEEQN